jgi:hypothetical protein
MSAIVATARPEIKEHTLRWVFSIALLAIQHSLPRRPIFSSGLHDRFPASANAHYAGKGVKKDTANRPIFWNLPEGSKSYRLVDATLTSRGADNASQIEGAVLLSKRKAVGDGLQ